LAKLDGPLKGGVIIVQVEPKLPMQVEETSSIVVELSPITKLATKVEEVVNYQKEEEKERKGQSRHVRKD